MLRHPGYESALLTSAKSAGPGKRTLLQGLLHLAPDLWRELIKNPIEHLRCYLSPTERIQQKEAYRAIGDQGCQLVGRQDGIAAGEASQGHYRSVCLDNELVGYSL